MAGSRLSDRQTRRRTARTGLTAIDDRQACPGFVPYCPMYGTGDVYLIDIEGREVHKWNMPYSPGLYGYLLSNGNLFYLGVLQDGMPERFYQWNEFKGGIMLEASRDGEILWEHRDPDHHHDARRTASGGVLYLSAERIPVTVAAKVKGGICSVRSQACRNLIQDNWGV